MSCAPATARASNKIDMGLWLELLLVIACALGLGYLSALTVETVRTGALVRRRMRAFAESLSVDEAPRQTAIAPAQAAKGQKNALLAWLSSRFPLAGGGR